MKSFKSIVFLIVMFLWSNLSPAQSVCGKWYSIDNDGQKETIVELYKKEGKLFGKIVALLQEDDKLKTCKKCPGEFKGKSLLGLEILRGFTGQGKHWTDGSILVPKTGRQYKCNIDLEETGKLVIRGYLGISLFGRSTYWYPAEE